MMPSTGMQRKKIIVTDSQGQQHEFIEVEGETAVYLEINPIAPIGLSHIESPCIGAVEIMVQTFAGGEKCESEAISLFVSPSRVEVIFIREGGE